MAAKLNEGSEFTIPLKNLIALIAFTGVSVWGYFGITERLAFLEHEQKMHWEEITENDIWIDEFEPSKSVQETVVDVAELKTQIRLLKYRIEQLEKE
jgi:hypothetical protein